MQSFIYFNQHFFLNLDSLFITTPPLKSQTNKQVKLLGDQALHAKENTINNKIKQSEIYKTLQFRRCAQRDLRERAFQLSANEHVVPHSLHDFCK